MINIDLALITLMEECSELTHRCSKIIRFGNNKKSNENLIEEIGDVLCLIDLVVERYNLDQEEINSRIEYKRNKLISKGYLR